MIKSLAITSALALSLTLTACGNTAEKVDSPTSSTSPKSDATQSDATTGTQSGGGSTITLPTATGDLEVTLPSGANGPQIKVLKTPYSVTQTQVKTLKEGDGPVVGENATVSVDYLGVNGRDGKPFDSSYQRGSAATFPLNGVVPGFAKAIAGQKVGSDVIVAMTPEDGYGSSGQPAAGIEGTDTLIFFIHINEVQ